MAGEIRFDMRHDHLRKGCAGYMIVRDDGITFVGAKDHAWAWEYGDIQELKLGPRSIHLLTYRDSRLRLGSDIDYEFEGDVPREVYAVWKQKLDQRFVAGIADAPEPALFAIPAKHLNRIQGSEGVLEFGEDRIVYATDAKGESRTWRFSDLDNISTTGPFQLTITTFERARLHYGDRKGFNFQLKQPLSEARYNEIWRRIFLPDGRVK